jgi:hypothetical protein
MRAVDILAMAFPNQTEELSCAFGQCAAEESGWLHRNKVPNGFRADSECLYRSDYRNATSQDIAGNCGQDEGLASDRAWSLG